MTVAPLEFSKKELVILTAARKVLSERGYRGTTISMIVEEAGISRGLLHYYFKNKDDLVEKVFILNAGTAQAALESVFEDCRTAEAFAGNLTRALARVYREDPDFYNLIIVGAASARHQVNIRRQLEENLIDFRTGLEEGLRRLAEQGVIAGTLDPGLIALAVTAMLDGFGIQLAVLGEKQEAIWQALENAVLRLVSGGATAPQAY